MSRQRVQCRRVKRRLDAYLDAAIEARQKGTTMLEDKAVTTRVARQYDEELKQFTQKASISSLAGLGEDELDSKLADYFERSFFEGNQPSQGGKLVAALMHRLPAYGKNGTRKIPRAWRALRGWKKLCPARSRKPEPLRLWAGIANAMALRGQYSMGMFVLMSVTTYLRPSSLLALRRCYLIAPSGRGSNYWTLLAHPREGLTPSKTGEFDLSIPLDSGWFQELVPMIRQMKQGSAAERVFPFTYYDYLSEFKKVAAELKITGLVPYQTRHSGASIDRQQSLRTLLEVKHRGDWRSDSSVRRYDKHGRVQLSNAKYTNQLGAYLDVCERRLADTFLRRRPVPLPVESRR